MGAHLPPSHPPAPCVPPPSVAHVLHRSRSPLPPHAGRAQSSPAPPPPPFTILEQAGVLCSDLTRNPARNQLLTPAAAVCSARCLMSASAAAPSSSAAHMQQRATPSPSCSARWPSPMHPIKRVACISKCTAHRRSVLAPTAVASRRLHTRSVGRVVNVEMRRSSRGCAPGPAAAAAPSRFATQQHGAAAADNGDEAADVRAPPHSSSEIV